MKDFIIYLETKGYSTKTIPTFQKAKLRFDLWTNNFGTTPSQIDYKTFLKYVAELKQTAIKSSTLNSYIGCLKIYFNYLQEQNYRTDNPIENINIKGKVKTQLNNLLTADELEDLYYSYGAENPNNFPLRGNAQRAMGLKNGDLVRKRNKIIVGLLVYQGLHSKELQHLKVENIELYKGKIIIPQTKTTNGRTMELKPWQLMEMMEYLQEIRPQIAPKNSEQLFTSIDGNSTLINVMSRINKELKLINYNYQSAIQIRSSLIVNWLKIYNLRKTQVLAGHRYISSTERYKQDNLVELHEMINAFHPIK